MPCSVKFTLISRLINDDDDNLLKTDEDIAPHSHKILQTFVWSHNTINPLSLNSDQHQFSPNNI